MTTINFEQSFVIPDTWYMPYIVSKTLQTYIQIWFGYVRYIVIVDRIRFSTMSMIWETLLRNKYVSEIAFRWGTHSLNSEVRLFTRHQRLWLNLLISIEQCMHGEAWKTSRFAIESRDRRKYNIEDVNPQNLIRCGQTKNAFDIWVR